MNESGVLGGLGSPELMVLSLFWLLPFWILWKFYRVLSRIAENLAGIRQTLADQSRRVA